VFVEVSFFFKNISLKQRSINTVINTFFVGKFIFGEKILSL